MNLYLSDFLIRKIISGHNLAECKEEELDPHNFLTGKVTASEMFKTAVPVPEAQLPLAEIHWTQINIPCLAKYISFVDLRTLFYILLRNEKNCKIMITACFLMQNFKFTLIMVSDAFRNRFKYRAHMKEKT
jgi:hypothetical protein